MSDGDWGYIVAAYAVTYGALLTYGIRLGLRYLHLPPDAPPEEPHVDPRH